MAYIDLYNQINANLKKLSTPKKKYEDEVQRRAYLDNYIQLSEGLQNLQYQHRGNIRDLSESVNSASYGYNNVRGSWAQDAYNRQLPDVNQAYRQGLNSIAAGLRSQLNAEWAYANRPRGGGGRPNPPPPPTTPAGATVPVQSAIMNQRLYDPNTFEGQSTGLYYSTPKTPPVSQYELRSRRMY